jgi:hypothetical protein
MLIDLVEITPKIQLGWEGQLKGMLQVLWERGWIDENNLVKYTFSGRKNEIGVIDVDTNLKHLLGCCCYFAEEESLLKF